MGTALPGSTTVVSILGLRVLILFCYTYVCACVCVCVLMHVFVCVCMCVCVCVYLAWELGHLLRVDGERKYSNTRDNRDRLHSQ